MVAARAGVSLSTLFRHFGDLAGLHAAMRARISARVLPILAAGPFTGPRAERVRELVRRRGEIFEMLGPFRRQALLDPKPTLTARQVEESLEVMLRTQITEALQPELDAIGSEDLVEALSVLLSFESWDRLRRIRDLDVLRTTKILEAGVMTLLESFRS
jgi:AcrR family transcriptional regulator